MSLKIENIFCPIDLTSKNDNSLNTSINLADLFKAKLFVYYFALKQDSVNNGNGAEKIDTLPPEALKKISGKANIKVGVKYVSDISESDNLARKIVKEASQANADLIVMGPKHQSFNPNLLDSTSHNVCRTASCPVLVTGQNDKEMASDLRILAAHDFSNNSELALQYACLLAKENKAELYVLHVIPQSDVKEPQTAWSENDLENFHSETIKRLEKSLSPSQMQDLPKVNISIRRGKPYRQILDFASKNKISLITMGSHGADFGLNTLFGSNVDRVLRQSSCPILVANPLKISSDSQAKSVVRESYSYFNPRSFSDPQFNS